MITEDIALPLRIAGGVWGHLVGDAMGVPYEFREPDAIGEVRFGEKGSHGQPPGTWSDDGALMLALLDSLLEVGFDTQDQGRRALAWRRDGAYTPDGVAFDIGTTTTEALRAIEQGTPAEEAGPTHERSQSNGSLMRILPLALWGHAQERAGKFDADVLIDLAIRASKVTHGHAVPQVACAVYTLVAAGLLRGAEPAQAFTAAIDDVRGLYGSGRKAPNPALAGALYELIDWLKIHEAEGRGGALNAFWSAWTAFAGASSYRETIERAIRYGNDTDTTAAIAGGLAGIRWGLDGIPAEWLAGMRGREIVEPMVDRLIAANGWRTSTSHPIRVDWVDLEQVPGMRGWPGRLGMTFLPGKQYVSSWSGEWWRDLERDVARLRDDSGCDVFLLLVEDHELEWTRTTGLPAAFERHGIELLRHPVVDMDVPTDRDAYRSTLDGLTAAIRAGKSIVAACRGGLGRTGTAVACLLVGEGMDPAKAIALTRASRRNTIERGVQVEWVTNWGTNVSADQLDRPEGVAGRLHDRLTEAAAAGELVYYSELEGLLKLDMRSPNDRKKVGEALGEISRWEVARGRPMLSSVVWHKDLSGPGRGFYNLGVELGLVRGNEDELAFATRQLKAAQAEWSRRPGHA